MKKLNSYDSAVPYTDTVTLPVNGYIIGILDVIEKHESWGDILEIKFDIAEGEYKNYYTNQYRDSQFENKKYRGIYRINIPKEDGSEQDGWTLRRFKTDITAIEASNPGFHWDWNEQQLKGKTVGMVFQAREWELDGKSGFWTAPHSFKDIELIRSGKYKIPDPRLLNKASETANSFIELDTEIELPF